MNKFLKIENQGLLDLRLISLMGGTTKANDSSKQGQFGTGLKYAISYCMRNNLKLRLFIGLNEVTFETKEENISEVEFKEIYCNGESMKITTHYGYQWEAWEAIREFWCNATDEGKAERKVLSAASGKIIGKENTTTFFIEISPEVKNVIDNWSNYFLSAVPLFEDDICAIYANPEQNLKIYKNGILIHTLSSESLFIYDFKKAELNELRQYRGFLTNDICKALLHSNKMVVRVLLEAIQGEKKFHEVSLDWSYLHPDSKKVKANFSGYLFLHPKSGISSKGKSVKVSEALYNLLKEAGLPCEIMKKYSGGSYGGGGIGYSDMADIVFKEVSNPELSENITNIAMKYNAKLDFIIGVGKSSQFEVLVDDHKQAVFSSDLDKLSVSDLESVVLVTLFHKQEGNIYKALKRLIKIVMKNKNFKQILFGR